MCEAKGDCFADCTGECRVHTTSEGWRVHGTCEKLPVGVADAARPAEFGSWQPWRGWGDTLTSTSVSEGRRQGPTTMGGGAASRPFGSSVFLGYPLTGGAVGLGFSPVSDTWGGRGWNSFHFRVWRGLPPA